MLDDGGPSMEQKISTKAASRRAVQSAAMATSSVDDVIRQYEELIREINVNMSNPAMTDMEKQEFTLLQKTYMDHCSCFQAARAALARAPPPGIMTISPQEDDAISILWASGKCKTAQERGKEVADCAVATMPVATAVQMPVHASPDEREV